MALDAVLRLPPLPTIRDILRLYRLNALKKLSQNFLMDERIIQKIVKAAGRIQDGYVCEVGPGPGGITRAILRRRPKHVVVVEKDPRFVPSLELVRDACGGNLDIIVGDVLSYNMEKSFPEDFRVSWDETPPNIHLIGNLPFSVSTPLIIKWIKSISEKNNAWTYGRTRMTLTFQKEVAERMVAPVADRQRCRLSIMCQNWCKVEHKFTIPGSAFLPKPDVDVGVVHLTPLVEPVIKLPFPMVEKVVRTTFSLRQKHSIKGIRNLFPSPKREEFTKALFEMAEVNPTIRPFEITIEEFKRLCFAYKVICDQDPKLYEFNHRAPKAELQEFEGNYIDEPVVVSQ